MRLLTLLLVAYLVIDIGGERSSAQSPQDLEPATIQDLSGANVQLSRPIASEQPASPETNDEYFLASPFADSDQGPELIQPGDPMDAEDEDEAAASENENSESDESEEEGDEQSARDKATLEHLQQLRKPVGGISLTAGVNRTEVPEDRTKALTGESSAQWVTSSGGSSLTPNRYTECITYQPLYYEHANLERCGIGHGYFQSTLSGVRFWKDTLFLAYKIGRQHPSILVRSPGDCQSCQSFPSCIETLKTNGCSKRGVLTEAAALAGFSLLLL